MATNRSTVHDTFVIERSLAVKRELAFSAWASLEAKSQWFVGPPGWEQHVREQEFRVGGRERLVGRHVNGKVSSFDARYYDIIPNERIVYVYEMHIDDKKISVSLATIEFKDQKGGTQIIITEQGTFLDGYDDVRSREHGTRILLDQYEKALPRP
jgi:uncharacterized protein YndB with AHSA1/START domain